MDKSLSHSRAIIREVNRPCLAQDDSDSLIASIPGALYIFGADGRYRRWNSYLRDEICGRSDAEMPAVSVLDVVHPDDRRSLGEHIAKVLEQGAEERVEGRILVKGGPAFHWFLMTGRRIIRDGDPCVIGIGIDITERKQMELALQASETKFFHAFMSSPQVMIITRPVDGMILEVNPAFESMVGYSRTEAIGTTTLALGVWPAPEDRQRLYDTLRRQGSVDQLELRFRRKNGEDLIGLLSARLFTLNDEPLLLGGVIDITARKQAEETLRETNAYLDSLFDYANAPIIVWDAGLHITSLHRTAAPRSRPSPRDRTSRTASGRKRHWCSPRNRPRPPPAPRANSSPT